MASEVYGRCPKCGANGVMRERRPHGNDMCGEGHTYPSSEAVTARPDNFDTPDGRTYFDAEAERKAREDYVFVVRDPNGVMASASASAFWAIHEAERNLPTFTLQHLVHLVNEVRPGITIKKLTASNGYTLTREQLGGSRTPTLERHVVEAARRYIAWTDSNKDANGRRLSNNGEHARHKQLAAAVRALADARRGEGKADV